MSTLVRTKSDSPVKSEILLNSKNHYDLNQLMKKYSETSDEWEKVRMVSKIRRLKQDIRSFDNKFEMR